MANIDIAEKRKMFKEIRKNKWAIDLLKNLSDICSAHKDNVSEISKDGKKVVERAIMSFFDESELEDNLKFNRRIMQLFGDNFEYSVKLVKIVLNKIIKGRKVKEKQLNECKMFFDFSGSF